MMQLKLMQSADAPSVDTSVIFFASLSTSMTGEIQPDAAIYNSRSTAGTYIARSTELLSSVGANVARFEDDGMLCEPEVTNSLLDTNDFTTDNWAIGSNVDATPGAAIGPDGNMSATMIACNTDVDVFAIIEQLLPVAPACFTLYAKAGNYSTFAVGCSDAVDVLELTDEWQRISISSEAGSSTYVQFGMVNAEAIPLGSYVYVAFANADLDNVYQSSYIAATDSPETRGAETFAWGAGNVPTLAGDWAVAVDIKQMELGQGTPEDSVVYVSNLSGITAQIRRSATGEAVLMCGSATITGSDFDIPVDTWTRVLMTGNGTNCRLFVNGVQIGSDTAHGGTPLAATDFQVNAAGGLCAHIRNLATYNKYADASSAPYL